MKITDEHYSELEQRIKPSLHNYEGYLREGKHIHKIKDAEIYAMYKLLDTNDFIWICEDLYPYLDDSHVDSALREIVRSNI